MFSYHKRLIFLAVSYATGWSVLKAESDYLQGSGIVSLKPSVIASSPSPSSLTIAFRSGPSPTLQVQHLVRSLSVCPSVRVQQNATNTAGCSSDCRNVATAVPKKRPEIKHFQRPLLRATKPSFIERNAEISPIKNSQRQITFRGL